MYRLNLLILTKYVIISYVAHYSSGHIYYEGEPKKSLKSTPMKLFVLASYAQFGVSAGRRGPDCLQWHVEFDPSSAET